jgi:hypothetical protein
MESPAGASVSDDYFEKEAFSLALGQSPARALADRCHQ